MITGVPASAGVAVGPLHIHLIGDIEYEEHSDLDAAEELERLDSAVAAVDTRLTELEESTRTRAGEAAAEIFGVHKMFLADPSFTDPIRALIEQGRTAESAVSEGAEMLASEFEDIGDDYFSQRAVDIRDIGGQLIRSLAGIGGSDLGTLSTPVVIAAEDLTPSDTASIPDGMVLAFVTAFGSATSHTAILARAMGVPAVVGVGNLGFEEGTTVIVDGDAGTVIIEPDDDQIEDARTRGEAARAFAEVALASASEPAVTIDGHGVEVVANIGTPADARRAVDFGAEGVGLLRTEFLFLDRPALPNEDEQIAEYAEIFSHFPNQPVVVRTLDVGGDKHLPSIELEQELNPFLGKRGIRLTFAEAHLFTVQIRAILRAGANRSVQIMFPMVASVDEIVRARARVVEIADELGASGEPHATDVEIGVMIEVPSAAVMADVLVAHVDFFSIGTNDLTQYTLAVDRTNPAVAHMADALHPAVLRLIRMVVTAAHDAGRWVGVCGELAGDPVAAPILVGLGVDELSMSAPSIPLVKQAIRQMSRSVARDLAMQALDLEGPNQVRDLLATR
jgi:phosphoenolpyruvate-protein phosphotransferase